MDTPVLTLMRLEACLLWRTGTPWLIAALFIVTSTAAIAIGTLQSRRHHAAASDARQQHADQYTALLTDLERVEEQRAAAEIPRTRLQPGFPSPAAVEARLLSFRAALPVLSTAMLSAGALQTFPQRYEVRGGGSARYWPFGRTVDQRILSGFAPEQPMENPSAMVIGLFDFAFIAVHVYPLLVLALSYNIVSADREAGILALVAAQPITCRRWLAIRAVTRGGVILLGLSPPLVAIALMTPEWSSDILLRLTLWSVAVLLYGLLWMGVATAISARTASASVSAVVSAVVWLMVVIAMPAVVSLAGPFVAPASTRIAYANEERAASLEINPRVDGAIAALNRQVRLRSAAAKPSADRDHPTFTEPIAAEIGADLLEALDQPPWSTVMPAAHLSRAFTVARRTLVEKRLAPVLRVLEEQERRETALYTMARFALPGVLLQSLIDDAAGTGHDRRIRFLGQLDNHVRMRESFFTRRILESENITSDDTETLTPFHYREEEGAWLLGQMALPLLALLAMCVCSTWISARASRRWCP